MASKRSRSQDILRTLPCMVIPDRSEHDSHCRSRVRWPRHFDGLHCRAGSEPCSLAGCSHPVVQPRCGSCSVWLARTEGKLHGGGSMAAIQLPKGVASAINFKGGTGKTTVAIAISEGLCRQLGKRVLIIDCDFQCSASIALLGRRTLNDLIAQRRNARLAAAASDNRQEQHSLEQGGRAGALLRQGSSRPDVRPAGQSRHAAQRTADPGGLPRRHRHPHRLPAGVGEDRRVCIGRCCRISISSSSTARRA